MAMPMSALASTGASLIPSPTKAKVFPGCLRPSNSSTLATLSPGSRLPYTWVIPSFSATAFPTSSLSPVSITKFTTPFFVKFFKASGTSSRTASEMTIAPKYPDSSARYKVVPKIAAGVSTSTCWRSIIFWLPRYKSCQTPPVCILAQMPWPGTSSTGPMRLPSTSFP